MLNLEDKYLSSQYNSQTLDAISLHILHVVSFQLKKLGPNGKFTTGAVLHQFWLALFSSDVVL